MGIRATALFMTVLLGAAPAMALAQAAPQQPPAGFIPGDRNAIQAPDYGAPIGLDAARALADRARAAAVRLGFSACTIAITGPSGSLILFEKMDGTTYASAELALAKARTAAITRRVSGPGPNGGPAPLPDMIALPGGVPIVVDGKTVGGLGISGTNGGDVMIAEAALNPAR